MTGAACSPLARWRGLPVAVVAQALGMQPGPNGGGLAPCPSCGATTRSRAQRDHRGPLGLHSSGRRWKCWRCGAGGDAVDLVALRLTGRPLASSPSPIETWRWLEEHFA